MLLAMRPRTVVAVLLAGVAGAAPAGAAEPVATTEGEQPGVRLDVTELKRTSGGALMLKFRMINESDKAVSFSSNVFGEAGIASDYRAVGGVHLVDVANKKKYLVLRDSEKTCLCSRDVENIEPGGSTLLWARFPAPPESVETIAVVVPHFIPMDDVPISR